MGNRGRRRLRQYVSNAAEVDVINDKQNRQRLVCSPDAWYRSLPSAHASLELAGNMPALVKHFRAIPGAIEQPPLNAHVVALHLGGAKRVCRTQGKRQSVHDVALGSMTVMPAYQANQWRTEGPIEFAHVTLSVGTFERIILEEFDREPATHQLLDTVGIEDALMEQVFRALLAARRCGHPSKLHLESLMTVFAMTLVERHSTVCGHRRTSGDGGATRRGGLAGWQLRRVVDFMDAHMNGQINLGDLAGLTGLSRAHFFRSFRQTTGRSPGQLLADIRMRRALTLLETTTLAVEDVAAAIGFNHVRHFATAFTKRVGVSPRLFRLRQK